MTSLMFVPCLAVVLGGPVPLPAQPAPKAFEPKVNVTVVTILASDRCKCIDPRLKFIAAEVRKADSNLTGFSLVSMTQMSLAVDQKAKFACIEGTQVEVVIRQCIDKEGKVSLSVTAPLQNEIAYRTVCGKFLPIVTRYQAKEQIPPLWVAKALGEAIGGGPVAGPLLAMNTLMEGRSRSRLIIAISVQPCIGK